MGASDEFKTDFSKHIVRYSEVMSGGPPKDGIPPIDKPKLISVAAANAWLKPREPVIRVVVGGDARAYPIQVLMYHEIANDVVGGKALSITFCPLCNTAIVFEGNVKGQTLTFGTTGRLRNSNLIMYDRQTETWWQQASGRAIAGELTGSRLSFFPGQMIAWEDFKRKHPKGLVMSRETGHDRRYGHNPYSGYDDVDKPPFLYRGPKTPDVLRPVERVLAVELGGEAVAYPYSALRKVKVINDTVGGKPIVVFWKPGATSALDEPEIAKGRDVGSAVAYSAELDGSTLKFELKGGKFADSTTASHWDLVGYATDGKSKGKRLAPIAAVNHFWFSWAVFKPKTRVYGSP